MNHLHWVSGRGDMDRYICCTLDHSTGPYWGMRYYRMGRMAALSRDPCTGTNMSGAQSLSDCNTLSPDLSRPSDRTRGSQTRRAPTARTAAPCPTIRRSGPTLRTPRNRAPRDIPPHSGGGGPRGPNWAPQRAERPRIPETTPDGNEWRDSDMV